MLPYIDEHRAKNDGNLSNFPNIPSFSKTLWERYRFTAFLISVYSIYFISVAWEYPLQLTTPQNVEAVLLSGFKALAIPLLFLELKRVGFRPTKAWGISLYIALLYGMTSLSLILIYGLNNETIFMANMGRFIWLPFLITSWPIIYKKWHEYI
jgi:hypothetical protein